MSNVVVIDGAPLACAAIAELAQRRGRFTVSDEALKRAQRSHDYAAEVARTRPVYGRSTGVGANRSDVVSDPVAHAQRLLRSHATSAGPLRAPDRVRAMLVVRLNQLAAGGSGADPAVLTALAAMLTDDAVPAVREYGSIGTGDLSALAVTALTLAGEVPAARPLSQPVPFGPSDVLSFLSSNAAALGDAALGEAGLNRLAEAAMHVVALTFAAVDGNAETFADAVEHASPFPGVRRVCTSLRRLIGTPALAARIQDPFGLRTFPQVHGAFLDALALLDDVVARMSAATSENPVYLPGSGIAHHGGFHAAHLVQALDAVRSAAAQSAQLGTARLAMLCEPDLTNLPPFLADGTPGASGVMVCEYVAASALGSLRALAAPIGVQSVTLSRGVEEDASFAALAARQALDSIEDYRTILSCELVAAVRALRMRGRPPSGPVGALPHDTADRDLTGDLAQASGIVDALAG
jgi:histidine ammonia-lyase